jgi:hypothetical protein
MEPSVGFSRTSSGSRKFGRRFPRGRRLPPLARWTGNPPGVSITAVIVTGPSHPIIAVSTVWPSVEPRGLGELVSPVISEARRLADDVDVEYLTALALIESMLD